MGSFFHEGQAALQEKMQSSRIANRLEQTRRRTAFNEVDLEIIASATFFVLASSTPNGGVDCSIKCGPKGFVRIEDPVTLLFPDYDGNGMFRSLGNIVCTGKVALLFVEFSGDKRKLRIHGLAAVREDPALLAQLPGAQLAVEVKVSDLFPNCPRYLPTMEWVEDSEYIEALGSRPLEPLWKEKPDLRDFVHPRRAL